MLVDFNEAAVIKYQNDRLDEGTAPKTINEEVSFLLTSWENPATSSARGCAKERC